MCATNKDIQFTIIKTKIEKHQKAVTRKCARNTCLTNADELTNCSPPASDCMCFRKHENTCGGGKVFICHTWSYSEKGYSSDLIYCFSSVYCQQLWRLYSDSAGRAAVALAEHLDLWQVSDFQQHVKSLNPVLFLLFLCLSLSPSLLLVLTSWL